MSQHTDVEMLSQIELDRRVAEEVERKWQGRVAQEEQARRAAPRRPEEGNTDAWIQQMFSYMAQSSKDTGVAIRESLKEATEANKTRGEKIGLVPSKFLGV